MYTNHQILIGKSADKPVVMYPAMANRHGMIAGATGTGKTVTLKVLAESFSDAGVPVFLADVKGDLAATCQPGTASEAITQRIEKLQLEQDGFHFQGYPLTFWDVYGKGGIPLRTTISEMGPLLLAQILDLNEVQSDVLTVVFKIADDENLLLLDTKDLKSMLAYVGEHAKEFTLAYGNIAKQTLGAITRAVVALEADGGELFFGEPALNIAEWFATDSQGKGNIQVLDCRELINHPTMYATFMLWLMSELFEVLPEAGDLDKPKMVFFFDEAHLLFDHASKALLTKIEQVVKLIRSKGVGIYFITQNPKDIPDGIMSQLGHKIQHALRAYTPNELKAAKAAAQSFRANPAFDTFEALTALGTGEALVSVLDEKGIPTVVEQCMILPPQSCMGALADDNRAQIVQNHLAYIRYAKMVDRESAYEMLSERAIQAQEAKQKEKEAELANKERLKEEARLQKEEAKRQKELEKEEAAKKKKVKTSVGRVASSAAGTIGRELGNEIGKSVGGSFGKKIGGNVGASIGRGLLSTLLKF